jgi:hypothetical protein
MLDSSELREFHPAPTKRRNEFTGWFLVFMSAGAWWVLASRENSLAGFVAIFFFLFLFVAAGTSLFNWMERHTVILLSDDGVKFENGLRTLAMSWGEIEKVQVLPSRLGNSVHVIGSKGHFHFQMAVDLRAPGRPAERIGFNEGTLILSEILKSTGLQRVESNNPGRYYARG